MIEIETVRKFPSVPMVENCCKGIFSQFYLKAYGEYVGLGIYFSKRIHFLKFISYQSFVGMVIFFEKCPVNSSESGWQRSAQSTGPFHSPR